MVSTSKPPSVTDLPAALQEHVDLICLAAMETQRDTPDQNSAAAMLERLRLVRERAGEAGATAVVEATELVEEAFRLATAETSAPAPYLGHFVTSVAAGLVRVIHAVANGESPEPYLDHARATLMAMPRRGSDFLVEIDLSRPEEVARIFAAIDGAGAGDEEPTPERTPAATGRIQRRTRVRELRQLLGSYIAQAEALRRAGGSDTLGGLLLSARALRGSAAGANLRPVQRLAARVAQVIEVHQETATRPDAEARAFLLGSAHVMAALIDAAEHGQDVERHDGITGLLDQSAAILRRFEVDMSQLTAIGPGDLADRRPSSPLGPEESPPSRNGVVDGALETTSDVPASAGDVRVWRSALERIARVAAGVRVRGGGHHQRSRRLALSIGDVSAAGDRLLELSRRLEGAREAGEIASELAELAADLAIAAADLDNLRAEADAVNARAERLLTELDRELHQLRLAPLSTVFSELTRSALERVEIQGKRVALSVEAGSVRVDGALLPRLQTALERIVLNAIDHGIEPPETRRAAGKPAEGRLRMQAHREGEEVVITVADDGAGIDERQIVQRAIARGYPVPAGGVSRERALQLIFLPGMTARDAEFGHGLDVASALVAALRGTAAAASEPGRGTTITLRLPLAVPPVEAVIVEVSGARYALPFEKIEVVQPDAIRAIEPHGTGFLADLGAVKVSAADLGGLLGVRSRGHIQDRDGVLLRVRHDGAPWLIRVDRPLGREGITIETRDHAATSLPGTVGSARLASGEVIEVLDLAQLLDARRAPRRRRARQTATLAKVRFALVADASVSTRRGLGAGLERLGWRAVEACDGLEAWQLLDATAPDILIIDLDLPLLDSEKVIQAARERGGAPVVALVARDDAPTRARLQSLGVDAYLTKPWDDDHLTTILSAIARQL